MPTLNITGKTRIYGTIADPIAHVRAPMIFNPYFERHGIDAVMVPIHAGAGELAAVCAGLRAMPNFGGMCVTLPHKIPIMELCDEVGPAGRFIGAVNAVAFDSDRRMLGDMFDGKGFVAGMREQGGYEVTGRRILQIGAGGAGRAVAFELGAEGAGELVIANRTRERAEALAERVAAACPGVPVSAGEPDPRGFDIVINCTALGLRADDPLPLDPDRLDPSTVVAEIIMIPETTKLIEAALARGCPVQYGRHMLDCQQSLIAAFIGC